MMIEIDVSDEINPAIQQALNSKSSFLRKITKSLGYMFQKETKKGVKSGAPNGERYPKRVPYKLRKALDEHAQEGWYGALQRAIGYEYLGNGSVAIGWTSATASRYGHLQEQGYSRNITSLMRKKWASAGYPLAFNKKVLKTPARPVFEPMSQKIKPMIVPYLEEKVSRYIEGNVEWGKKKNERRVYKVYK